MALAVIVFALGCIQLLSTVHVYVTNVNELNANRALEARLVERKADLENDIARWDDKAYVVAQARDRLGFVFPGEKSVRVLHPEAVTGGKETSRDATTNDAQTTTTSTLPWYKEMVYLFKEADEKPLNENSDAAGSTPTANGSKGTDVSDASNPSVPSESDPATPGGTDDGTATTQTGDPQQ